MPVTASLASPVLHFALKSWQSFETPPTLEQRALRSIEQLQDSDSAQVAKLFTKALYEQGNTLNLFSKVLRTLGIDKKSREDLLLKHCLEGDVGLRKFFRLRNSFIALALRDPKNKANLIRVDAYTQQLMMKHILFIGALVKDIDTENKEPLLSKLEEIANREEPISLNYFHAQTASHPKMMENNNGTSMMYPIVKKYLKLAGEVMPAQPATKVQDTVSIKSKL